jgi:hypothetical protein
MRPIGQPTSFTIGRRRIVSMLAASMILGSFALSGCAAKTDRTDRPFFRNEYGLETHGRKNWFDHLVELDPGELKTKVSPDYEQAAPQRIAVLPFGDHGRANFTVDKVPLTFRSEEKKKDWAWTDANRMRRAVSGYLAPREFQMVNLIQVDEVLQEHGIDTEKKLLAVSPETLGKWLGVDAVVYGDVTNYEAYYAFLVSAWQVGADVKMVSTHSGEELFSASGSRYSVDFMPAFDPMDIVINSGLTLLELRDVTLARAEEEDAREIVLRIPRSEKLRRELVEQAHQRQVELELVGSDNTGAAGPTAGSHTSVSAESASL